MPQTATNPDTGERFVLINGQWVPMTQTATNPDTGEKFGLAGNQWVPIGGGATPAPAPAAAPAAPALTPQQRQAVAQRESERGFFGRAFDKLMGNEIEAPEAYTPQELAARAREIREEQKKLTTAAARFDQLASEAAKQYQSPNAPDRAAGLAQRAQAARDEAAALARELETITKTGLKVPEAQTTREVIGALPRELFGGIAAIPGGLVQLLGTGLEAAGADAEGITEAGRGMRRGVRETVEDIFGAPGEALQYDPASQLAADVSGGVGSLTGFLLPGGAAKVAGVGKGLTGAERAAEIARVARPYEYGLGTAQGLEQGIRDVEATEARTGEKVSPGRAFTAYLLNAGLGATEVGVFNRIFERIPVAQRGAALDAVSDIVRRGTAGRVDPTAIAQAVGRTLTDIESRAVGRIAVRGAEEALQEMGVQAGTNIIAKGLYDSERDITEGVGYAGLVGGIVGGGLRGGVEVAQKVLGPRGDVTPEGVPIAPEIRQEFQRLAAQEVAAAMQANPELDQKAAVDLVAERAEELLTRAAANVVGAEGGADVTPAVGPAVDVGAGVGAGVAPDLGPAPAVAGTPDLGEAVTGRLGEPVPSVPVPDVGTRAGEPALTPAPVELPKITGAQVKATIPTIEQAFTDNQIDFEEAYGIKKLNAEQKKQAARIVLQSPEVDPYDAIGSVLERGQRLRGETVAPSKAPGVSRTVVNVGGQERVIETPSTPEGVAQLRAELGVAPEAQPTPTVAETATVEKIAPAAIYDARNGENALSQEELLDQLDFLQELADRGKLTPERLAASDFGKTQPTNTMMALNQAVANDPVGTVRSLRERAEATAPEAPSITPEPQYTPQEIAENLEVFAVPEAQDRGLDPSMFREGVRDIQRGLEPLTDQQVLEAGSQETLDAYKAGRQWAQERIAEAQAAPTQAVAKAAPARAPKKVKAVGTKGTKAKQVKAVINRKPGKTVAEKIFNMAQAEFDQTPKEDVVEQVTPYEPEYETIRSKPGVNVKRMAKLLDSSLYGDPSDMGQVCIKEVLQNSFDATRTAVNDGQVTQGKIEVVVSDDGRTLTVKDNGVGMPPEILGGKFLEIAGTAKEGDKNAGGFGIAKMLFLYQNKGIRVVTARDGRISELNTTGEQLFDSLENSENAPDITIREFEPVDQLAFPDGHGTIIQLTIPEEIGEHKIKELPRWLDNIQSLELSPLFSNIAVTFEGRSYMGSEDVKIGSNFPLQDYTQFVGVKFPWGTAKVYVTRNQTGQTYGNNMHILSNGLWQFSTAVKKDPSDMWGPSVPYTFYVDIVPSVKAEEFGYPFTFNRQGFTDLAKADFAKIKNYIDAIYAYKSRAGEATSFGNIQYFDANGILGPVIDLTPDIPVQDTAFTRIAEGDQITIGDDGQLLVNGQEMPELTPDQLKAGIPSASDLTVSPDLIDVDSVMVHDNADVIVKSTGEKMSIPDFMRRQFGERFDDFMRFNGDTFLTLRNEVARVMGYDRLRDEAIGVSFDPEYRGVSIRLPFSGSFINPLVPKYGDGLRAGYGIFGTMIHELAHHKQRSHNANFPAEMQDILLNMEADEGFGYQRFKDNFADTIAEKYGDIVQLGVELFNGKNPDISIEYRGNRFTDGSGEQAPEGTGAGGTGDVRGPSGERGTGEPVLGASFERTRGTGAGRDAGRGAGGGTEPVTDANVNKVVAAKLTKGQIKRLEEAAGIRRVQLSNMQQRIVKSRSAEETMSLSGKLMLLARKPNADVNLLTSLFNSVPPPILQKILGPMLTEDVVRLAKRAGMENISQIDRMIRDEYTPYVNGLMQQASKVAEKWADFASRYAEGAVALADVMFITNMYDVDPTLASSAADYAKVDTKLIELTAKLAAEKDPKKKNALKGQITRRRGEIQRVYYGGADPDTGAQVYGWNDLSRAELGGGAAKQLFRAARDHYRNTFNEHYRLLMDRIDASKFENEKAVELKSAVDEMFAKARERTIYFPLKRFGEYWVSVGKGQNSEFYMFETASEQADFLRKLRDEGETRFIDASQGKDTLRNGLRGKAADASVALKNILDKIEGDNVTDVDILKDNIFQMYLMALPEADMRRRFIHREFKTGFSTDALRTFASTAVASTSQLGRLAYNYKLQNLINASYAETAGNPSKPRLDTLTREIEWRVSGVLSPDPETWLDTFISVNSKATFLFLLSSPKSALMNLTQLHIVGLPTLSVEFGEKATYGMAARYTGQLLTGKRIAVPFRDEDGNVRLEIPEFTAEDSRYIRGLEKTDPDRYAAIQKAWEYARVHDVTQSTFSASTDIYERSNTPTSEFGAVQALRRGEVMTAAQRAVGNSINALGALFHSTERIGREIMYMSAFELAYDRNLKQGMKPQAAGDAAMKQAAKLTSDAMFDFSNWNKSRYSKAPVGRLALQMRSYSIAMSSLLFRSFYGMLPYFNKEGKVASAKVFFGVGAMTTLYGGFRASQFYVLGMLGYGLYEMLKNAFGDDEEEKEVEQGFLTPETIDRELLKYADEQGRELTKKDMEYFIRSVWIPQTFGADGTLASKLGIGDAAAEKLEAAADIGLPGIFRVDLSGSVSLGDLWHPVTTKADDPEVQMFEFLGRGISGPTGSMYASFVKAWKQLNEGDLDKAIETSLPALVRNFVKANRLGDEGLVVGKDRDTVLRDPSFYDVYTLGMQSLGFAEADTSRAMQLDIQAGDIERAVAQERTDLLDKRYRAILDTSTDTSGRADRALREVERAIEVYNLNYPSNAITDDTKERSFQQKQQEAAERMYGMGFNPKIPIRQPLMEERAGELGQ